MYRNNLNLFISKIGFHICVGRLVGLMEWFSREQFENVHVAHQEHEKTICVQII